MKRKAISLAEIRAFDSDPDAIKGIFAETSFNATAWLDSLSKEQVTGYENLMERNRGVAAHIQGIVDMVPTYAAVKALHELFF